MKGRMIFAGLAALAVAAGAAHWFESRGRQQREAAFARTQQLLEARQPREALSVIWAEQGRDPAATRWADAEITARARGCGVEFPVRIRERASY